MNDVIIIDGVRYVRDKEVKQLTAKYKVGDWVRVIANNAKRSYDHAYVDVIAKIQWVYDHGEYRREVNNELIPAYSIDKSFVVYEDELELAEEPRESPFDIAEGERYWWINFRGEVQNDVAHISDPCLPAANACKDKKLMEQRALHERLDRLLWRESIEAGESDNPWDDNKHYYIAYQLNLGGDWIIDSHENIVANQIYFPSKESAQTALDNIVKPFVAEHPDFVW